MSASTPRQIVLIGGGECAARAAMHLRQLDFDGSVTIVGDEPHAPYERPPLSKSSLLANDAPGPKTVLSRELAAQLSIELELGRRAVELDPTGSVTLQTGRRIPFDRLLLATGSSARRLPVAGSEHTTCLRTHEDAMHLRSRLVPGAAVVVIGAGLIGLEVSAAARQLNCSVTVLEQGPRPMTRAVPAEIAEVVVKRHIAEGVDIHCGVAVNGIHRRADSLLVEIEGNGPDLIADVVVVGIGAEANLDLASSAGIACDRGVVVDAQFRTSVPGVYAAGDCCVIAHPLYDGMPVRIESWRNAHDQAVAAAANMLGEDIDYAAVPWFWSDQYDLGLQVAGVPELAVHEVVRERPDGIAVRFGLHSTGRLVSAAAVGPGASVGRDIRIAEMLIGGRIVVDPAALADPTVKLKSLLN